MVMNGSVDLDRLLEEAKLPICVLDLKAETTEYKHKTGRTPQISSKLKAAFREMLKNDEYVSVKNIDQEELFIFYVGGNDDKAVFSFFNTIDIEKSIFEIEKIKTVRNEVDTILNAMHDDVLITDGRGIITRADPSFEKLYHVKMKDIEGKSVYELEKEGILNPSITAKVLEEKQQITLFQENKQERRIVTAIPIKDNKGNITKVISFSRDFTDFFKLKKQYEMLEETIQKYTAEIEELREKQRNIPGLIANSKVMKNLMEIIDRVSVFDANIVLEGESGVGKTMFAKLIHSKSVRASGPFIEINCGAIPENLLESELFGYQKGAFTGASQNGKIGLIQLADEGTLFLDEIGELPLNLQTKLLKVIQDKKIIRIGGTKTIEVDFRLITATNKNLKKLVSENKFREDLYYRLNVIHIKLPPLRERNDDIFNLAIHYLNHFNNKYSQKKTLSSEVIDSLINYNWPGNIRELENLIERIVITSSEKNSIINIRDLPDYIRDRNKSRYEFQTLGEAVDQFEKQMVVKAYKKRGTTIGVANELGISQPTAVRKIKKYIGNIQE